MARMKRTSKNARISTHLSKPIQGDLSASKSNLITLAFNILPEDIGELRCLLERFLDLAYYYQKEGRSEVAEAALRNAFKIAPDNFIVAEELGLLLLSQDRIDDGIGYLEQAKHDGADPGRIYETIAAKFKQLDRLPEAISYFRKNYEFDELEGGEVWLRYARMVSDQAYEEALQEISSMNPFTLYEFGEFLIEKQRYSEAMEKFNELLDWAPESTRALRGFAFSVANLGKLDDALEAILKATTTNDRNYKNWMILADVRFIREEYLESVKAVDNAIRLAIIVWHKFTSSSEVDLFEGESSIHYRRTDGNISYFDVVLDLDAIKSDLTHLYLRKVDSFVKLKNLKKAYATLSAAQRWDPAQASFYLYAIVLLILDKRMDKAKQKLLEAEKAGIEMVKEFGEIRKKLES